MRTPKTPSVPSQSALKDRIITLYQLPGEAYATSQMTIDVTSLGGSKLEVDGSGLAATPLESTANTAAYVLKPALKTDGSTDDTGTATLSIKNYTDPTVVPEDYTVNVLHSDLTGGNPVFLDPAKGKTTTILANSHEGFSVSQAIDWQDSSTQWFKVPTVLDIAAGKDAKVVLTTIGVIGTTTTFRPAIVTLKNKIKDGGDLKVTVTPAYTEPTVALVSDITVPEQNTLDATGVKIYDVTNSKLGFTATAIGGTKVGDSTPGITVTSINGNSYATTSTYTVTLTKGATSGSFTLVNNSDSEKTKTINVNVLKNEIIVAENTDVLAINNKENTISVTSPAGCRAEVTSWNDGSQWLDITTPPGEGTSDLVITQHDNNNTVMKPVQIRLTSKMVGGTNECLYIKITPTFSDPTLSSKTGTIEDFCLNIASTSTFSASAAGGVTAISLDHDVATVIRSGNTVTVKAVGLGTAKIKVSNSSNPEKTSQYTLNVTGRDYLGKAVWKYFGFYIAPENLSEGVEFDEAKMASLCEEVSGGGWYTPTADHWREILQSEGSKNAPYEVFKDYNDNKVFVNHKVYWSQSLGITPTTGYALYFSSSSANVGPYINTNKNPVRCISW